MTVKRDQSVIDVLQILMHEKMQPPASNSIPFDVNTGSQKEAPENIQETEKKPIEGGGILSKLAQNNTRA